MQIDKILQERGALYGEFSEHAKITQDLKAVAAPYYHNLNASQKECLDMVFHKIGRILNGNPNYIDSWVDIVGYTQLVVNNLQAEIDKNNIEIINNIIKGEYDA